MGVVKKLHIGTKLEGEFGVVRRGNASDEGGGAEGARHAGGRGEHVETADDVVHHGCDEQLREAFEREPMGAGAGPFLDGSVRPFDLADVTVGGDGLEVNGRKVVTEAFELLVAVHVPDGETPAGVEADNGSKFGQDGRRFPIRNGRGGAKVKVARDGVDESNPLHKKEVHAKNNGTVVLVDMGRDGDWFETRDASCLPRASRFAFII